MTAVEQGFAFSHILLVALAGFCSSIIASVGGFGGGLLLTPFLLPIVGIKAVVPVTTLAMIFGNLSRAWVYRDHIRPALLGFLLLPIVPGVVIGTLIYSELPPRALAVLIGVVIFLSLALRRGLRGRSVQPTRGQIAAIGFGFGLLSGSSPGAGFIIIAILLGTGLEGAAVLGTDAVVGLLVAILKTAMFGTFNLLNLELALAGVTIGAAMVPGAYVARWLVSRIGARMHAGLIELVVALGGVSFILHAFRT